MRVNDLQDYYDWLISLITNDEHKEAENHVRLLTYLYQVPFEWTNPYDENREIDGNQLREEYKKATGKKCPRALDTAYYCTVLEMMVALAHRCDNRVMGDPDVGDKTANWFWNMIENLELLSATDDCYDQNNVSFVIDRLINRTYEPDGKGSLFPMKNPGEDMRNVDIWNQLFWWIGENYYI